MLSQYMRLFTQTGALPDGDANNPADPLVDVSIANQDGIGILFDFNYLYIGQHYPFVNLFMLMDVLNQALNVVPVVAISTPYNAVGPVDEVQQITFPTVPTSGTFKLTYAGNDSAALSYNATPAAVEAALQALAGLATVTVAAFGNGYAVTFVGIAAPTLLTATPTNLVTSVASKFKAEYWDGAEWKQAVDVLDGTNGLYKSGMIQFSLRNGYSWCEVTETDDDSTSCPEALKGLYIDNCYWLRLSPITTGAYDAPNPITRIKRVCYAFTNTGHVNGIDIEGPSYYESIGDQTGLPNKSDWIPEIIHASEEMVLDLKRIGFIKSAGQIIELDELYLACAWKTLAHIYFNLGKAYTENRAIVNGKYEKALSSKALTFDNDGDGKLKRKELQATTTRMTR
jgi:hypothetical protein